MNPTLSRTVRPALIMLAAVSFPIVSPAYAQNAKAQNVTTISTPSALILEKAIIFALKNSPVLAASGSRAEAAEAGRSQAGALPNPEIQLEAGNIYGDGPYESLDGAELTYGVSQLVELPGKRSNRVRVADAEKTKVEYARDATRLNLIRDVTIAYAEVCAGQQEVAILEKERNLAAEVRDSVSAKVEAGKEPPVQKNKAEIELSASEIALDRVRRDLSSKKQALSALMGGGMDDFMVAMDSLPDLEMPQPLDTYRIRLPDTPDVKTLDAEVTQARSNLSLEKANALPDPTFNVGVRDVRENDSKAFIAGVSFPIPVFNLNRAGVKKAGHNLNAAIMDQQGTQLSAETTLAQVHADLSSAYSEASTLRSKVLPGAEEAFNFARTGYNAGKFGYLEVLDAQRTLFETRKQLNQSTLDYYRQRATIERMTALHARQQNTAKGTKL